MMASMMTFFCTAFVSVVQELLKHQYCISCGFILLSLVAESVMNAAAAANANANANFVVQSIVSINLPTTVLRSIPSLRRVV